jgi:DNA polymerase-1
MAARVIAWDTETCLIRPGLLAPPLVCVTWQSPGEPASIVHHADPVCEAMLRAWLMDPDVVLVGHNIAYDMAVIAERFPALRPLIFAAYDADRITDTQIRQWLLDNAAGCFRGRPDSKGKWIPFEYTLESLARRVGMELQKDGWRLSYSNFIDTPIPQWPDHARTVQANARLKLAELEAALAALSKAAEQKEARGKALAKEADGLREMIASEPEQCIHYPLDDARATLAVYLAQEKHAAYLDDQYRQSRAYFGLYLNSAWGLRTDEAGVALLRKAVEDELAEVEDELKQLGLMRADGSRDTKVAKARMVEVCRRERIAIPRTDAHEACVKAAKAAGDPSLADACTEHVCLDSEACDRTEDDVLVAYALATTLRKVLSNDIEALAGGILYPVHTRYGFAASGRTTSSKPNIQNQSKRDGIREAFVARPGRVFIQADYPLLELYTLAQCCMSWLGHSKLAEALNAGIDPHMWVASIILQCTYDDALKNKSAPEVKKARQLAKPANYGFPGGMGIPKFVASTRKAVIKNDGRGAWEGMGLDEARAKLLREQWFEAWPEMPEYFARVNSLLDEDSGRASVETLFTKRTRGNASYCATANNGFQALGADAAKRAVWLVARACYVDQSSPLFNSRPVAFVHDELIAETDDGPHVHEAAYELARLMAEGANEFLPAVPIPVEKIEPTAMRRWSKKATTVLDDGGRLVVWMPKAA